LVYAIHIFQAMLPEVGKGAGERKAMITITPAAKMRFRAITDVEIPEGLFLRLDTSLTLGNSHTPTIGMYVGELQQDDRAVEHEGETLLYVSGSVAEAYAGFVVDLEEGPEGLRFGLEQPEAGHDAR
jgi:Fe-S cluster assembly iron-binding protein IscA